MKSSHAIALLLSTFLLTASAYSAEQQMVTKFTVLRTAEELDPVKLDEPIAYDKLVEQAKAKKYEIVTINKRVFLLSPKVLPDLERIQLQTGLSQKIAEGLGDKNSAVLDMSKMSKDEQEAIKKTIQLFDPTFASQVDMANAKILVQSCANVELSNRGKKVHLTSGWTGDEGKDPSIIQTLDKTKPVIRPSKPTEQGLVVLSRPVYSFSFSLWMKDPSDRLEAMSDISKELSLIYKKEMKPLLEAYANLIAKLRNNSLITPNENEGAFSNLTDKEKTNMKGFLKAQMSLWGFADKGELDTFLDGATFNVSPLNLCLTFMSRDPETGQVSGHSIPFMLGNIP
jgi:hypothetical protein